MSDQTEDAPLWAHMIQNVLQQVTTVVRAHGPLRPYMPYCLHPMSDTDARCIVNRDYKPLGNLNGGDWADYETAIERHVSAESFETLRAAGIVNAEGYLHGDGDSPRVGKRELREYRRKLAVLIAPYLKEAAA